MENNFDTQGYLDMELLRFTTAGVVDDGKSTLIGRLLYDSKSIFEDQVQQIVQTSKKKGLEHVAMNTTTLEAAQAVLQVVSSKKVIVL